jgi:hypothetical protein
MSKEEVLLDCKGQSSMKWMKQERGAQQSVMGWQTWLCHKENVLATTENDFFL